MSTAIVTAARAVAASGDHRIVLPVEASRRPVSDAARLRIALCGNMANNAYVMGRALRRLGFAVDVLIDEAFFDHFIMNRPDWEEVEVEIGSIAEALAALPRWPAPNWVRKVAHDQEFGQRFSGTFEGVVAARAQYRSRFGSTLPDDLALLLAQIMSHWQYIAALRDYDVAVFMGAPMMLAPFCAAPYAFYPVGGDRVITPFEESLVGLLTRAGYRRSNAVLMSAPHFKEWYDRLGVTDRCIMSDFFIDTDIYRPGEEAELRRSWTECVGGDVFIVSTCRQSWLYKANDRLIRAFAGLHLKHSALRLVLTEWGDDVERTKELAAQLGLARKILWLPLGSKPVVARRQRAADIVVDQLAMASVGTCMMELMAAGKPVIARYEPPDMPAAGYEKPPLVGANSESEVAEAIERCLDPGFRSAAGMAGRQWMLRWCSHETKAARFVEQLAAIVEHARAG